MHKVFVYLTTGFRTKGRLEKARAVSDSLQGQEFSPFGEVAGLPAAFFVVDSPRRLIELELDQANLPYEIESA